MRKGRGKREEAPSQGLEDNRGGSLHLPPPPSYLSCQAGGQVGVAQHDDSAISDDALPLDGVLGVAAGLGSLRAEQGRQAGRKEERVEQEEWF
jgi:hypothetical protein